MRVTKGENHLTSLHVGFVTYADDIHLFRKAFGHALNRVVGQGPRQTMQRGLFLRRSLSSQIFAFNFERNPLGNWSLEHAFRALHFQFAIMNRNRDALGNLDRFFTNSRHNSFLISDFQIAD